MNKKLTIIILAVLIILIGKTEAVTLTQKVGDGVATTEIAAGENVTLMFTPKLGYSFTSWTVESGGISLPQTNPTTFTMPNKDVTIRINFDTVLEEVPSEEIENKYTVTYNSNGGTGVIPSQKVTSGEEVTLNSNTFIRNGYTFEGWSTSANGVVKYADRVTIIPTGNITLYAIWKEIISEYSISYNANGGSGIMASQTVEEGSSVTLAANSFIRDGYIFKGWSTSSSATTATYTNGQTITPTSNMTLYVVWEKETVEYTITYNANGGSGTMASQTVEEGNSITLRANSYTRSGYTFKGWSTSTSATTATYTNGQTITPTSNMTLYAVWEKETVEYTITYNANGGSGTMASQTIEEGNSVTLRANSYTRSGYTFKGWSTSTSATTATYTNGQSITPTSNMTLYAVWEEEIVEYTITYNANGGSGTMASQTIEEGNSVTLTANSFTRDGYTFKGWSTSTSATTATYTNGQNITPTSNMTLYAVWESTQVETITIIYDANGGAGAPPSQTGVTVSIKPSINGEPVRDGYTFLGWSEDSTANTATYEAGTWYTITESKTLYAVWSINKLSQVIIKYNLNGGNWGYTTYYAYNGYVTRNEPTKDGYNFLGWGLESDATSADYMPGMAFSAYDSGNGMFNLYAIWTTEEVYRVTLTYDANGGAGSPQSQVFIIQSLTDVILSNIEPTRYQCTFLGWAENSVATSAEYSAGDSIRIRPTNSTINLYAVWKGYYDIKYYMNDGSDDVYRYIGHAGIADQGANVTINVDNPEREGYTFLGWSTSSSAVNAEYQYGDSIFVSSIYEDAILYAVWGEETVEYTITYNANGGSGTMASQTVEEGSSITLRTNSFTRSGYTFKGWSTSSSATTATYTNGQSITPTSNMTLYAVWKANSTSSSKSTLAKRSNWYKGTTAKSSITTINISNSYTPTGSETESWNADINNSGLIKCYIKGTELIIAGNIIANSNCNCMFSGFSSVININGLDILDTSNVTDMSEMFSGCSSITSLDVSNFDTSNVTDMSAMFLGCSSITSLDVSKFDTSNVTDMSTMFHSCSDLKSLDLSKFDTSNVTDMAGMFYGSWLKSLDLSNFDTSNVTNMEVMFGQCSWLESLDVSKFDTSNVTDMRAMFSGCSDLTSLDLSNFDTSNVTDMAGMFNYCQSLTSLDVSSFDTSNVTDMSKMFYFCKNLVSLDLGGFNTSSAIDMSDAFTLMSNLKEVTLGSNFSFTGTGETNCKLPAPNNEYIAGADGYWYTGDGTAYRTYNIPSNVAATYYAVKP